jgi:RNA polymerase sigma-70 factor (ECF subfamily)
MNADERQACLDRARQGDTDAVGQLLNAFRPYVRVIVRAHGDRRLQGRVGESDLIQDALLEAVRSFPQFRGTLVSELAAWLRQITLHVVAGAARTHLGAGKRDLSYERPLNGCEGALADSGSSPSAQLLRHEQAARMAQAVSVLPDDMQAVLLGRHVDNLPYATLAEQIGRSEAATRVLYTRALRLLRSACQG